MSYRLKIDKPVNHEIQRIGCEQIDAAFEELSDRSLDTHDTVHQVRKRCKKLRGLIRLVRPKFEKEYQLENARLRDAAAMLSDTRDAQAVIETYDKLLDSFAEEADPQAFSEIREQLVQRRDALGDQHADPQVKLEDFCRELSAIRERCVHWDLPNRGFDTLKGGLKKTYKRGRKAMKKAAKDPTAKRFHEWRKRVKYHRYQVQLLRDIWQRPMKAYLKELHELSDLLGFEHDLAVLCDILEGEPKRFSQIQCLREFQELMGRRRLALQRSAHDLGQRVYAEGPSKLVKRLGQYWDAGQEA